MSGEITLADALEQVESGIVKARTEGLANLRHILRSNNKFENISDGSFHRVYEELFSVAVAEKSTYLKAKTPTTRTAAENRLSACAHALRLAIDAAVRTIRLKTVRSILDNVTET